MSLAGFVRDGECVVVDLANCVSHVDLPPPRDMGVAPVPRTAVRTAARGRHGEGPAPACEARARACRVNRRAPSGSPRGRSHSSEASRGCPSCL